MSEMRDYAAIRCKVASRYNDREILLKKLKSMGFIFDDDNLRFCDTEGYNIVYNYELDNWFIDRVFVDEDSADNFHFDMSISDLMEWQGKLNMKFQDMIELSCKLVMYQWYSGYDMPGNW